MPEAHAERHPVLAGGWRLPGGPPSGGVSVRGAALGRVAEPEGGGGPGARGVATGGAVAVDEGEGDARLGEQAEEEVEIGLGVLHPVLEGRVLPPHHVPHGHDPPLAEEHVDDVGDALVLEDAVVPAPAQEPQPGDDADEVGGEPAGRGRLLLHGADHPGEGALADQRAARHAQGGGAAHDGLEIDAGVGGEGPHRDREQGGVGLVDLDAADRERALAGLEGEVEGGHGSAGGPVALEGALVALEEEAVDHPQEQLPRARRGVGQEAGEHPPVQEAEV